MDKIHDGGRHQKEFGRASANEANTDNTTNLQVNIAPPAFQLKAISTSQPDEKELEQKTEEPFQIAAQDSTPPDDSLPSNGSGIRNSTAQLKKNNTGLPDQLKSGVEGLSGYSLDDVNVHYNSSKPAQLQAHAYAQGSEIHLGPGQERHLPHEAWHVVQQKQGRVQATTQLKRMGVNDDRGLEKEADVMGAKAMETYHTQSLTPRSSDLKSTIHSPVFQLSKWKWVIKHGKNGKWKFISGNEHEDPPEFEGEYNGEIYDDTPPKRSREEGDEGFNGARTYGNSAHLATARFNKVSMKNKGQKSVWKKNREAQHLIPACLCKNYKCLIGIIDSEENGMMLPAVYKSTNDKVTHRRPKYRDHPVYTANVKSLIDGVIQLPTCNRNQATMLLIMQALRPLNRNTKYQYLDFIPYHEFDATWNKMYGATHGFI